MEMEEYRDYMMWMKRKDLMMNSVNKQSWEEQAFAEDAGGPLGGFVWPPRSYPCSFCKRDFRSAQALGGHMNVHRRERARLNQSHHHPQTSTLSSYSKSLSTFVVSSSSTGGRSRLVSPVLGHEVNVDVGANANHLNMDFPAGHHLNRVGVRDDDHDDDQILVNCKRQKKTASLITSSSVEELDLELRLNWRFTNVK